MPLNQTTTSTYINFKKEDNKCEMSYLQNFAQSDTLASGYY